MTGDPTAQATGPSPQPTMGRPSSHDARLLDHPFIPPGFVPGASGFVIVVPQGIAVSARQLDTAGDEVLACSACVAPVTVPEGDSVFDLGVNAFSHNASESLQRNGTSIEGTAHDVFEIGNSISDLDIRTGKEKITPLNQMLESEYPAEQYGHLT